MRGLAVDQRAQGAGLGKALLRHVLQLAVNQREKLGCVGVVTDAKNEAVPFYTAFVFTPLEVNEGALLGDPLPMFLGMSTILAAKR